MTTTQSKPGHLVERVASQLSTHLLLSPDAAPQTTVLQPLAPLSQQAPRQSPDLPPNVAEPARVMDAGPQALVQPDAVDAISVETLVRAGMAVIGDDRSRVMEEWRVIASTLLLYQPRRQGVTGLANALMITSSLAREGKSFCAINLSGTLATNMGRATLLIDIDAKPNALTSLLGLSNHPGLLDLAANPSLPLASLIVPTALPKLHFLPLGSLTAAAQKGSDAGITHAVATALESVARQSAGRILVLDTAPCLATGDAATLAPLIGQIAMVVAAETTQRSSIDTALGLLAACKVITLVLNKARVEASGHFGVEYYGFDGKGG